MSGRWPWPRQVRATTRHRSPTTTRPRGTTGTCSSRSPAGAPSSGSATRSPTTWPCSRVTTRPSRVHTPAGDWFVLGYDCPEQGALYSERVGAPRRHALLLLVQVKQGAGRVRADDLGWPRPPPTTGVAAVPAPLRPRPATPRVPRVPGGHMTISGLTHTCRGRRRGRPRSHRRGRTPPNAGAADRRRRPRLRRAQPSASCSTMTPRQADHASTAQPVVPCSRSPHTAKVAGAGPPAEGASTTTSSPANGVPRAMVDRLPPEVRTMLGRYGPVRDSSAYDTGLVRPTGDPEQQHRSPLAELLGRAAGRAPAWPTAAHGQDADAPVGQVSGRASSDACSPTTSRVVTTRARPHTDGTPRVRS
jgi:hypothetical protein